MAKKKAAFNDQINMSDSVNLSVEPPAPEPLMEISDNDTLVQELDLHDVFAIVFTSMAKRRLSSDRAIREFIAWRWQKDPEEVFSHCGLIFVEKGKPWLYHQTLPSFARDRWFPRKINAGFIVSYNPNVHDLARYYLAKRRGYGVLQLLSKALTMLTFGLFPTPVKAGMDCSEAVARMLPWFQGYNNAFFDNTDPYDLYKRVDEHLTQNKITFTKFRFEKE